VRDRGFRKNQNEVAKVTTTISTCAAKRKMNWEVENSQYFAIK
jgi:hypothetical protein